MSSNGPFKMEKTRSHDESHEWEDMPSFDAVKVSSVKRQESMIRRSATCRRVIQDHIDSLWTQSFILLLVIFDLVLAVSSIISDENTVRILILILIIIYCIEIALRIYAFGPKRFFKSFLDVIDFVAVLVSLILYIAHLVAIYSLLVKALRWIRVLRASHKALYGGAKTVHTAVKKLSLVRSEVKGYRDDDYDLDISYITNHILIMSRPATSAVAALSHDGLDDVKSFLDEKHLGHYRIYDLCVYEQDEEKGSNCQIRKYKQTLGRDFGSREMLKHVFLVQLEADEKHHHHRLNPSCATMRLPDFNEAHSIKLSMVLPVHLDMNDRLRAKSLEYSALGDSIYNGFAFRGSTVLSMDKMFEFAEECMQFQDESPENVVVIQSTSGKGRSMFMVTVLLFFYYPSAPLMDIMRFVHHERYQDADGVKDEERDKERMSHWLPSQMRFIRYFATLIRFCYRTAANQGKVDQTMEAVQHHLCQHIRHQCDADTDQSQQFLTKDVSLEFDACPKRLWSVYHEHAVSFLSKKVGVIVKKVTVNALPEDLSPFTKWEVDLFQWKEHREDGGAVTSKYRCIEYDTFEYGIDEEPERDRATIRRFQESEPMVLERDFGVRIYKTSGNSDEEHETQRRIMAQVILHSHFLVLDEDQCVTFKKEDIDFVNRDVVHKHFPKDFNIVIKLRILRKKQ